MRSYLTELGSSERLTQFKQKVKPSPKAGQPQHPELKANFVEVQSDYIPSYVNQQKNRNTLSKMFYDTNLLTCFMHQETGQFMRYLKCYKLPGIAKSLRSNLVLSKSVKLHDTTHSESEQYCNQSVQGGLYAFCSRNIPCCRLI